MTSLNSLVVTGKGGNLVCICMSVNARKLLLVPEAKVLYIYTPNLSSTVVCR